jgi:hypothetical protein
MRPLVTWLIVGALAAVGLFAVRDALRGGETPARSGARPVATAGPPAIPRRAALARSLARLGATGILAMRVPGCRRFLLRLPDLAWTATETLSGRACSLGPRAANDERFGLTAVEVGATTIEVGTEGWGFAFEGTAPTFKPGGTLTFVRGGRLYEWTARCPAGSSLVAFRGLRTVPRCRNAVAGAPKNLRELVWLGVRDYVAVAGPDRSAALVTVRDGRVFRLFQSVGLRLGGLEASPGGRYVAARLDGSLALFRTDAVGTRPVPPGAEAGLAVAWSPDDRFTALATESFVYLYRSERPGAAVVLPLAAGGLGWR